MTSVTSQVMGVHAVFDCPICGQSMIWGGDHDDEDMDGIEYIVSNHSCNECNCWLLFGTPVTEPEEVH